MIYLVNKKELYFTNMNLTKRKHIKKIVLPNTLSFKNKNFVDFESYLSLFDWDYNQKIIYIDGRGCKNANYQALSLLILYCWHLKRKGVYVKLIMSSQLKRMWTSIGGVGSFNVLEDSSVNFRYVYNKPLFAIRNPSTDIPQALNQILDYSKSLDFDLINGHEDTLRYIISELLYNTVEHGYNPNIPSLLQFNWYRKKNQLSFILADLGVGIKSHLENAYPHFESDRSALEFAIKPEVSGTFNSSQNPYNTQNNAGMGLFISSNLGKKLEADMYIVSGSGLLHISPTDITSSTLRNHWPGTFIYITIGFDKFKSFVFSSELERLRAQAKLEVEARKQDARPTDCFLDMFNLFGPQCEVKYEAVNIRDRYILPAINNNSTIILDFSNAEFATHSFLVALLATPIRRLGLKAYKKIKIKGANDTIRSTLDFIFDSYTSD